MFIFVKGTKTAWCDTPEGENEKVQLSEFPYSLVLHGMWTYPYITYIYFNIFDLKCLASSHLEVEYTSYAKLCLYKLLGFIYHHKGYVQWMQWKR